MESGDSSAGTSRDSILEDVIRRIKNITELADPTSKFVIRKLEDVISPTLRYSYVAEYDSSTGGVTGKYVYLFDPVLIQEYVKTKRDATARFAPVYLRDDRLGILTMDPQGASFEEGKGSKESDSKVVGLALLLSGTENGGYGEISAPSGRIKPSKVIVNYRNLDDYNNRGIVLFVTDPERMEGYGVSTDYTLNELTLDTKKLIRQCLSSEGGSKHKSEMISAMKKRGDKTQIGYQSLFKFSVENDSIVKNYLDPNSDENSVMISEMIDTANSIVENVPNYKAVISAFVNGNPIGFYDLMNAYKRSYSKVVLDYLTNSVELKSTAEKVEYTLNAKHISYKREEFMKMLGALSKADASIVEKKLNESAAKHGDGYEGMYR
jgi:hypothetical protein